MSPPNFLAAFDSASVMAMATAAYLRGEDFPALGNPEIAKLPVKASSILPKKLREKAFVLGGAAETVSPRRMKRIDVEEVSEWLLDAYPDRTYPVIAVGSSNGALVHLYAALGIPWLPQTFLIPVRDRVHPDDPWSAYEHGLAPGRDLVEANPGIQLHHMHDANQDRLMVRALTYFRYKRQVLGAGYEKFLRERLAPGGTILLVECGLTWGVTRVGDRHVFQHGALGGAREEEFHEGSERVEEYLERYDSPVRRWDGPEPDERMPEAEWGFADPLRDDVERFAREHGYQVRRLRFDHPQDPSPMVADLYQWWYRRRRIPSSRLLVESFALLEPYRALRTGSVPYWMFFNEENSLAGLERYLDERDPFDEIHLMLFQNGVDAVGTPSADEWRAVLDRARRVGRFAGLDIDESPWDLAQLARYDEAIDEIAARYPVPGPLSFDEFTEFLEQAPDYERVRFDAPLSAPR